MEALLRHWGCHVAAAGSPHEAMRALDAHLRAPDLIVTDYRLPEGTAGIDAIVAIRTQAEQRVPAIVVTGDVTAPVLDEARLEAVALLHKPVDIELLRRTARAFLDAHLD
jgi:CheY-like chemotaxis protein